MKVCPDCKARFNESVTETYIIGASRQGVGYECPQCGRIRFGDGFKTVSIEELLV